MLMIAIGASIVAAGASSYLGYKREMRKHEIPSPTECAAAYRERVRTTERPLCDEALEKLEDAIENLSNMVAHLTGEPVDACEPEPELEAAETNGGE